MMIRLVDDDAKLSGRAIDPITQTGDFVASPNSTSKKQDTGASQMQGFSRYFLFSTRFFPLRQSFKIF
jgi:hypothetical protein